MNKAFEMVIIMDLNLHGQNVMLAAISYIYYIMGHI